jgi:hypothetical protein
VYGIGYKLVGAERIDEQAGDETPANEASETGEAAA